VVAEAVVAVAAPAAVAVAVLECCPTCSLSVLWHEEAFHKLGVQGVKVSTLPCASPLPNMAPASQQGPNSQSPHCLCLCPSHHFGFSFHALILKIR
jgi:hypothetical protein